MQFYKTNPQHKSFRPKNNKLLKKIDKGHLDIRNVMKYMVENNYLPKETWGQMDTVDAWRWLTLNEVDYNPEPEAVKARTPKEIIFSLRKRKPTERNWGAKVDIPDED